MIGRIDRIAQRDPVLGLHIGKHKNRRPGVRDLVEHTVDVWTGHNPEMYGLDFAETARIARTAGLCNFPGG